MVPVKGSGRDVVEAVIVDPRQPVGPVRIGPDPCLEGGFDLGQLFLGRLRVDDVEDAAFAVAVLYGVKDLRDTAVKCIGKQLASVAPHSDVPSAR